MFAFADCNNFFAFCEKENDCKQQVNKVKSVKEYMKIREDYIHSFIEEHERDVEPEEEAFKPKMPYTNQSANCCIINQESL